MIRTVIWKWLKVSADMTNVILMFHPMYPFLLLSAGLLLMIFIIGFSVSVQEINDHCYYLARYFHWLELSWGNFFPIILILVKAVNNFNLESINFQSSNFKWHLSINVQTMWQDREDIGIVSTVKKYNIFISFLVSCLVSTISYLHKISK